MLLVKEKKVSYFFREGFAEGSKEESDLLGGKGASLSEMCRIGIPVPPGFVISSQVCREFKERASFPEYLVDEIKSSVRVLEKVTGKGFGSLENPLLLSVRSGSKISMPGMMDTILNLGINDAVVEALKKEYPGERTFVLDTYRRFIEMYATVVHGVNEKFFERIDEESDCIRSASKMDALIKHYKNVFLRETGKPLPMNVWEQLFSAIHSVFLSWENERAVKYRNIYQISHSLGTAVNIQAMVFGNRKENSCTGVLFTRNPSTGSREITGEYLAGAQGEDVVAGIRTPFPISRSQGEAKKSMEVLKPELYSKLKEISLRIETHYKDMQDIEFTEENGKLWILQTRSGKRTGTAEIKIAVDMAREKLISKEDAVLRVSQDSVSKLFYPVVDKSCGKELLILKGLPASPGAVTGTVVFEPKDAENASRRGEKVILFRKETSPEDISGMSVAKGIVTSRGGMTSHAAVVARGMGKPCICGTSGLVIHANKSYAEYMENGVPKTIKKGDTVTMSGKTGEVFLGEVPLIEPEMIPEFFELMEWCQVIKKIEVRANADNRVDCLVSKKFGANGIGLCRTEHMFFEEEKIGVVRELIISPVNRKQVLDRLLHLQKEDFKEIFLSMSGFPVNIRLLDPPLHEFLSEDSVEVISRSLNIKEENVLRIIDSLKEENPMLGNRGVRLGIVFPDIYTVQVRAIFEALSELLLEDPNFCVLPEIMVPFIFCENEIKFFRAMIDEIAQEAFRKLQKTFRYRVGAMIELPRAALLSDKIAKYCDFFSFGTNDLTQTTFGISRDDATKFMGVYIDGKIIDSDPFTYFDEEGVGELMRISVEKASPQGVTFGVCGEHGSFPEAILFFRKLGIHYVSCSPYRIPVARLSAAAAEILHNAQQEDGLKGEEST